MAPKDWKTTLTSKAARREKAQAAADAAQADLYDAMLAVFEAEQASYREIAGVVGLSRIRVGQVLRLRRQARGLADLEKVS